MRDLNSNIAIIPSIPPAVYITDTNGTGVDLLGFNSAVVEFSTGADVGGTHAPKIQESDVLGSGYTDVAAVDLIGSLPADMAAASVYRQGYKGNKQFIRAVVISSTTSLAYAANVIKGNPDQRPTS